jgi:hypothetical protein
MEMLVLKCKEELGGGRRWELGFEGKKGES